MYQYIVQRWVLGNAHGWLNIVIVSVEWTSEIRTNVIVLTLLITSVTFGLRLLTLHQFFGLGIWQMNKLVLDTFTDACALMALVWLRPRKMVLRYGRYSYFSTKFRPLIGLKVSEKTHFKEDRGQQVDNGKTMDGRLRHISSSADTIKQS